jgi:hypothetical protein
MNNDNEYNRFAMFQNDADMSSFVDGMRALHEEMTELFLNSSKIADFPEANAVIDRIRNLG